MFRSGFEGSEHAYADAVAIVSEHANVYGESYNSVRWRKSKKSNEQRSARLEQLEPRSND